MNRVDGESNEGVYEKFLMPRKGKLIKCRVVEGNQRQHLDVVLSTQKNEKRRQREDI